MNGSSRSTADEGVFQKLSEARELYEDYLAVASVAELATLRDLAIGGVSGDNALDTGHTPQPLTISFRSIN